MIGGAEVLERGGDMPEPWLIDLIRNPQDEAVILQRLGGLANKLVIHAPSARLERHQYS